jgi:hypothetical protein
LYRKVESTPPCRTPCLLSLYCLSIRICFSFHPTLLSAIWNVILCLFWSIWIAFLCASIYIVCEFELRFCVYSFYTHLAKGHVSFCHHLASVVRRPPSSVDPRPSVPVRPSVVRRKLSHLNLLLWKPWTELNQTWQGWSLGGYLSILCPTAPPSIQNDRCY